MGRPARHRLRLRRWQAGSSGYMYFTYVLQDSNKKLYVGFCQDLTKRLHQHNTGKVKSTKYRKPLKLVYYEACLNKEKAVKREKYFKSGYGRGFLKKRI